MPTRGNTHGSGRVAFVDPNLTSNFANSLWADCPMLEYLHDPSIAVCYHEPFINYDSTDDWTATQATSGTAAISTTVPGAILLDPGATTAHQGIQIQRLKAAFIPAAGKDLWFEVGVQLVTGLTVEFFAGLAASDTTIIASGAMSTNNRIGWTGTVGDGVVTFQADKAGTHNNAITGVTLSTSVWHRLGFKYDGTADTVQQFVDGVASGSPIATADIPKVVVYPSFVCQTTGTTQSKALLRGLRVFQLR
jgi:hypothetical protein